MSILETKNLTVDIPTEDGVIHAVQDVSFKVEAGSIFGIVGESGSGKSVMVQTLMGLVPTAKISGEANFNGKNLLTATRRELRSIRGREISMIFQDPLSSLHPQYTIGWQIVEQIRTHEDVSKAEAKKRTVEMLGKVGIPEPEKRFDAYPHQFSGGMRQRVMIAMALVLRPALIIADEPTTALDSTVQAQILDLLEEMRREFNTTVIIISHDLGVINRICDEVMVMYAGNKVESGPSNILFNNPSHPYTAGLLRSSPVGQTPRQPLASIGGRPPSLLNPPTGCVFAERCPDRMDICSQRPPLREYSDGVSGLCWLERNPSEPKAEREELQVTETMAISRMQADDGGTLIRGKDIQMTFKGRGGRNDVHVLKGIDIEVHRGETLGLVGESGCGKSTLARVLSGLIPATGGEIELSGKNLSKINHNDWRELRKEIQLVFQDPYGSLNPRRRVGSIINDPFRIHNITPECGRKAEVQRLMELVGLNPEHYNRYPSQFSGGQRQRIGIARALALNPSIIIFDEPVSALDVSIQAQILNLMDSLQRQFNLTYLFISHDLSVVRHVCDRIAVMDAGRIIELDTAENVYSNPQEDFTKKLLDASMHEVPDIELPERILVRTGE